MADEHFLTAGDFPSGLGATPFFGSGPYAPQQQLPTGLDITACAAAMAPFGMLPWDSELPFPADAAETAAHFDSALSSLVSSPAHASGGCGDDVAIGDLIGRLGSICHTAASANNSCYSTPLSSPPRGASPALAFRWGCYPGAGAPPLETGGGSLSWVASSKSLGAAAPALEEMSPKAAGNKSTETPAKKGDGSGAALKRKASGKGKTTATAVTDGNPKRSKVAGDGDDEDVTADAAEEKKPEPVKDYIHVRARRGQATDSHSLAERVRREKISERMKLLQSLVPGCNKVTGKALMLDEIVNYVQSLQRQVEFLSMKLSTMNPQLDVDAQFLPSDKDMMMHHETGTAPAMLGYYPPQDAAALSYADPAFAGAMHPAMESCTTSSSFHPGGVGSFGWEERDLQQSIVHRRDDMAPSHDQQPLPAAPHPAGHGFHGGRQQQQQPATTVSHMKVEP